MGGRKGAEWGAQKELQKQEGRLCEERQRNSPAAAFTERPWQRQGNFVLSASGAAGAHHGAPGFLGTSGALSQGGKVDRTLSAPCVASWLPSPLLSRRP